MAVAAGIIFLLLAFILVRASSDLTGSLFWLFLLGVAVTPIAAWFLGRASLTGLDLYRIGCPRDGLPALVWRAAVGESEAVAELQATRDRLRAIVAQGSNADEPGCRGAYSVILERITHTLNTVGPDNVVPVSGSLEDKERFVRRLEAELTSWRADYLWFEKLVDCASPTDVS
jgi:hypothetical protein